MLFNSLAFCLFFVLVTCLYYALPWAGRWKLLLFASCYFYMSFVPIYILILLVMIVIDYAMGIFIDQSNGGRRKIYLAVSIAATCLVLFVFKYYNFFVLTVRSAGHLAGVPSYLPLATFVLPIGLSFHTFQSLSYVIEVYRGKQQPERNFGIYALYVMFYPQLVAGPIERPQNLLHQFYVHHRFNQDNIIDGLFLMAWGFFQKMVIADRAAMYVSRVYGNWQSCSGLDLLIATILFAVQIYADFAGYSSIAIGTARVMGFELMTNFNHPYFSRSIGEFWRRWHISLSTWFKDYVYIPLGGSRVPVHRMYLNLLLTFTISGLWHGANWTFVIWGLYNGALLVLEHIAGRFYLRDGVFWSLCRRAVTMTLILIGWVFFRSQSVSQAVGILHRIATGTSFRMSAVQEAILIATGDSSALPLMITTALLIATMFALEALREGGPALIRTRLSTSRQWQAASIVILFQVVMLFGVLHSSAFIYFQF